MGPQDSSRAIISCSVFHTYACTHAHTTHTGSDLPAVRHGLCRSGRALPPRCDWLHGVDWGAAVHRDQERLQPAEPNHRWGTFCSMFSLFVAFVLVLDVRNVKSCLVGDELSRQSKMCSSRSNVLPTWPCNKIPRKSLTKQG